ncbi:MAG TPA: gluconate 2-dehydrogenase subunit 3 family protein [Terriglobia bacterium]|nr:gluconate 2-dehydrogenase subunit 3 family protein [Terriglobia bacterium]
MEKKQTDRSIRFERRDILKLMTSMPAAALVSVVPFASEAAKAAPQQSPAAGGSAGQHPKVHNPHEWKTIRILSDLILPADARSGSATQAGVPEFIDDWLSLKRGNLLAEIRGGLTWLDLQSNRSFKYDFADCPAARQKQILDRIAYPEKAAPEDAGAVAFFNTLRDLVVSGFFTSQAGVQDLPYLGNEPQSEWKGCPAPVLVKLGVGGDKTPA